MAVAAEAMSEDERTQFERLTGTKSAILRCCWEDEASEIVRNLSPKEVQHLEQPYSVQGLDQYGNFVLMNFQLSKPRLVSAWGQALYP